MKYPETDISSIADMLSQLKTANITDQPVWYRGHGLATWTLQPAIARDDKHLNAELTMMKRFKQNALTFLTRPPATEWDWLFYMQHYGLPTRLLD